MKAKIYTKTGDQGQTSLVDGTRVSKSNLRLDGYGSLDELNSLIGLVRSHLEKCPPNLASSLDLVQNSLFDIGSHLACADEKIRARLPQLRAEACGTLEKDMDQWEAELPALKEFILPGGAKSAAICHLARTVCRRAEREIIRLQDSGELVPIEHIVFINRLSDWLFLLARKLNEMENITDITWSKK